MQQPASTPMANPLKLQNGKPPMASAGMNLDANVNNAHNNNNQLATPANADNAQRGSLAPNNYNHIMQQPTVVPNSQPVVASVGNETKRRPFRQVIKEALQLAKDQRAKYGKFVISLNLAPLWIYDVI